MIIDGNRLYLQRYWKYETMVAEAILTRCAPVDAHDRDRQWSHQPGSGWPDTDPDQQRAIAAALSQRFTVISGGPGTGKTFTIAQIIALIDTLQTVPPKRILLAAPTGKAAARLQEALEKAFRSLSEKNIAGKIRIKAQTIHRLLGAIPNTSRFRHNADNPLAADVVIVDEASMIDLAMMSTLMDAVPPSARLILVGDKDQLASVEAGAVLGDICGGNVMTLGMVAADDDATLPDGRGNVPSAGISANIIVLRKNYRFGEHSGIHRLGQAVKNGDADLALSLLRNSEFPDIVCKTMVSGSDFENALTEKAVNEIEPLFSIGALPDLIAKSMDFKILTAVRKGPVGVESLNAMVEDNLMARGAIHSGSASDSAWYHGKPVMISRNDYYQNLFNGDIGIAVAGDRGDSGDIRVAFERGRDNIHYLVPEQLPPHETVYAMTVHKSQGTEFDKVVLILPDNDIPLLTRELIYTAITRARLSVEIWAREDILKHAIGRCTVRASGLRSALWDKPAFDPGLHPR